MCVCCCCVRFQSAHATSSDLLFSWHGQSRLHAPPCILGIYFLLYFFSIFFPPMPLCLLHYITVWSSAAVVVRLPFDRAPFYGPPTERIASMPTSVSISGIYRNSIHPSSTRAWSRMCRLQTKPRKHSLSLLSSPSLLLSSFPIRLFAFSCWRVSYTATHSVYSIRQ